MKFFFIPIALLLSSTLSAAPIEAVFQGVITTNFDEIGSIFGKTGENFLVGESVTVRFTYDSSEPLTTSGLFQYRPSEPSARDWISSYYEIGGIVFPSDLVPRPVNELLFDEFIHLIKDESGSGLDAFTIWETATYTGTNNLSGIFSVRVRASVGEFIDDLIRDDDSLPDYPIRWLDNDDTDLGGGAIEVFFRDTGSILAGFGSQPGGIKIANVDFDATSFALTPVPIPSALWLLLSGLGVLGYTRSRNGKA
jgi:hypothetical protein